MKLSIDRNVAGAVFRLSWPAMLEQFLVMLASLVDTAMVGSLGAVATAAVGIIAPATWVANAVMLACATAFSYIISRAAGAGETEKVNRYVTQSISFSALVGCVLVLIYFSLHNFLPRWMGAEADVVPDSSAYIGIVAFGMLPQCIAVTISGDYRSAGNARLPMFYSLGANFANVVGNYFMIFTTRPVTLGALSFTMPGLGLGVAGAALSTALSQLLLLVLLLWSVPRKDGTFGFSLLHGDYRITREVLKTEKEIGLPVLFERWTLSFGQVVSTALISRLGTVAISAHYLTCEIEGILYMPAFGMQYAATALIGQAFGAENRELVMKYKRYILIMGIVIIEVFCIPVALCSHGIMGLFSSSADVVETGTITLFIAAITELFFSLSLIATGIFRGAGDVKFSFAITAFGMWIVRLPLLAVSILMLKLGVIAVWIIASTDCMIRMILALVRLHSNKWIHEL